MTWSQAKSDLLVPVGSPAIAFGMLGISFKGSNCYNVELFLIDAIFIASWEGFSKLKGGL